MCLNMNSLKFVFPENCDLHDFIFKLSLCNDFTLNVDFED